MRLRLFASLAVLLAPLCAAAAPMAPLTAVPPPVAASPALEDLSILLPQRASQLLVGTGRYADIGLKQLLRMAEREGIKLDTLEDPQRALAAAKLLGAHRVILSRLSFVDGKGGKVRLEARLVGASGAGAPTVVTLDGAPPEQLEAGARALAGIAARVDHATLPPGRTGWTKSPEALAHFATCERVLVRQPIGIENPTLLSVAELGHAVKECQAAVAADPSFDEGWAALGLAQAIGGDDAAAVQSLLKVTRKRDYMPLYWIARYWLLTRHDSAEAGEAVLEQGLKDHPGFLLFRGYLAEHFAALKSWPQALEAWRAYLAVVPDSPFIRGRISSVLAHMGRTDEAIKVAREGLALAPESRDLAIEVGSRLLDAGKLDEAIATLKQLADKRPSAEALSRLGYAQLLKNDLAGAEASLLRAEKLATHAEWRTRGRVLADLARVALRKNDQRRAAEWVQRAKDEDLLPVVLAQNDAQLNKLASATRRSDSTPPPAPGVSGPRLVDKPHEISPFSIGPTGDVEAYQRPWNQPVQMIELLRF